MSQNMNEMARLDERVNSLTASLDRFISSQNDQNKMVSDNLAKLTDVLVEIKSQQIIIAQLEQSVMDVRHKFDQVAERTGERLGKIESNQAVNKTVIADLVWLKRSIVGMVVSIFVGIAVWAYKSN